MSRGLGGQADEPTDVLIVGAPEIGWAYVRRVLEDEDRFHIADEAQHRDEGVRLASRHRSALILLALDVPGDQVTAAVREFHICDPECRVVVFGERVAPEVVRELEALGKGGGYLLWQDVAEGALLPELEAVRAGLWAVSPGVTRVLHGQEGSQHAGPRPQLDERQQRILLLLMDGRAYKEIAHHLSISQRAVRRVAEKLKSVFGVTTLRELVRVAAERGYQSPEDTGADET